MGSSTAQQAATMPDSIPERYALVRERIARAAERSGQRAEDILLVAVSKTAEPEQLKAMIDLGHRDFGENRVQTLVQHAAIVEEYLDRLRVHPTARRVAPGSTGEFLTPRGAKGSSKPEATAGGVASQPTAGEAPSTVVPVRWHMIGHLQRNKARKVAEFVRLVHSVDSLRLAEELQVIATRRDQVIDVLVQVNCSGEASKFGCPVPAALPLAEQIDTMVNVRVRGLMTMAAIGETPDEARAAFSRCRDLYEELRKSGISRGNINLLSMGMSGDFEAAIQEGANIVRVGSAIFGEGHAPDDPPEAPEPE